jgi:Txe/YoeB family toxin of toxin-antitoxin system
MREIKFTPTGFEQYNEWAITNKKIFIRIGKLIKECTKTPFTGTGKPEPLKYDFEGYWSRRISAVAMGPAMYSRIESGKTEPSLTTLEKIAKALGVTLSDFFAPENKLEDTNSYDGSLMEKVKSIETLNDKEKKTVFSIVDAFVGKKKLKDALESAMHLA